MSDPLNIPRPIARGASSCHILALRDGEGTMVAACGIDCGTFCGEEGYERGVVRCHVHEEPLCESCREIIDHYEETGSWKGVTGGTAGRRMTGCLDAECPELIPIEPCWCWEHIETCSEVCDHGAHLCNSPAHYCAEHKHRGEEA